MSTHNHYSNLFHSCFRPSTVADAGKLHNTAAEKPPAACNPNLTTSVYHTSHGLFALTWSRNLMGRSLHLHALLDKPAADEPETPSPCSSLSSPSFTVHFRPFFFWEKTGSRKLNLLNSSAKSVQLFWDLSGARFGSQPEPESGFYIAVLIDGEMALLARDAADEAYSKTKSTRPSKSQAMVLRREHVYGNKLYTTKAYFAGKTREISIDCRTGEDPRLHFSVDGKRILQIKHLKWKFRGSERIEIDGAHVQISWDVCNWLFEDDNGDGHALFMFGFENREDELGTNGSGFWSQQSCGFSFEKKMMKKRSSRKARSSSSSSSLLSSASSSCSSVMEWASMEENELQGPSCFSLLVYAW